ncbi:MAG: arsenite efflux transporter metallochaperone ArsD [Balneolales bacterium]
MTKKTATKPIMEVYDPAMCCSTGVCGPDVDDRLADFANDIKWLKAQGFEVKRYNLGQEPEAFKSNVPVVTRLQQEGTGCLPMILINGDVVSESGYPDKATLVRWLHIEEKSTTDAKQNQSFTSNDCEPGSGCC